MNWWKPSSDTQQVKDLNSELAMLRNKRRRATADLIEHLMDAEATNYAVEQEPSRQRVIKKNGPSQSVEAPEPLWIGGLYPGHD